MAKFKLTGVGKICAIAIVVACLGAVAYFTGLTKSLTSFSSSNSDADVTIAVNTYAGMMPLTYANNGLEPTEDSYFYQKYGLKVKILIMDDFDACRAAFKNGTVDVVYATLDALPVEMSASGDMTDARYFMLLNHSNGADALVANSAIQSVADMKGKKVAFAQGTASHTLLINTLETSGLSMNDVEAVLVENGIAAAQAFKARQVDMCVCWSPDDVDLITNISGAHVLTSTADASSLVSDGLVAKKSWLENNNELATKLVEAILWANVEVKTNAEAFQKACESFAQSFETDVEFAQLSGAKINFASLQDNVNWMNLNPSYTGMTGDRIYTKMARIYSNLDLCKSPLPWTKVAYTDIIESLMDHNTLDNAQEAIGTAEREFSAPSEEMTTSAAISNKKVTINFPTNGFTLDNVARETINREFVDIAQQFSNCRIRVEGNTDNTGNYNYNVELSKKRAEAVVDYLVNEYNMPRNRFVVVGNGPKHAAEANVNVASEEYRTTDFQLLSE